MYKLSSVPVNSVHIWACGTLQRTPVCGPQAGHQGLPFILASFRDTQQVEEWSRVCVF
jgi:hypothetical protein